MEAINIMYINSVNMDLGPESTHAPVTGFYPLFANINHDCSCNTKTVKHPDNRQYFFSNLNVFCVAKHIFYSVYLMPNWVEVRENV